MLNDSQLERISDILGNLGLLFFASTVIPYLLREAGFGTLLMALGLSLSFGSWLISLMLLKGIKR